MLGRQGYRDEEIMDLEGQLQEQSRTSSKGGAEARIIDLGDNKGQIAGQSGVEPSNNWSPEKEGSA